MIDALSPVAERARARSATDQQGLGITGSRDRIALVTPWHPEPVDNGSKQRIRQLISALAGSYDIVLISLLAPDQRGTLPPVAVPGVWRESVLPLPAYQPHSIRALLAALQAVPRSFAATWDPAVANAVNDIVKRTHARLVIGADLRVLQYLMALPSDIPTLIDEANTSPFLAQARPGGGVVARLRAVSRQRKYARLLRGAMKRLDAAIVSSAQEAHTYALLSGSSRVAVIENGVGMLPTPTWRAPASADLLYAGSLTYAPNTGAVAFFAREVLRHVERAVPEARLVVTGTLPETLPPGVVHPRVTLTGRLDMGELEAVYRRTRASVIPLLSGTGTRIKVLEAMGRGIPVVSTSKGVEGLNIVPGVEFLLADTPADFAAATVRLLQDASFAEALGARGRERIRRDYTWESRGRQLRDLVRECLARAPQGRV